MKNIYIYHHLGLGDHIICNAIIRSYAKKYDEVYLFVKSHYIDSVGYMFRDLNNVKLISVLNDDKAREFIENNKIENVLRIGFENLETKNHRFDEGFYKQVDINFNERWDNFFILRSLENEVGFFNKFKVKENEYIFLHEDRDRGLILNRNYFVNKTLRVIEPVKGITNNIFDYCYLLENAAEIHCMDSCFKLLADSLNPKTSLLFHHLYLKGKGAGNRASSSSRKNWAKLIRRNYCLNKILGLRKLVQ